MYRENECESHIVFAWLQPLNVFKAHRFHDMKSQIFELTLKSDKLICLTHVSTISAFGPFAVGSTLLALHCNALQCFVLYCNRNVRRQRSSFIKDFTISRLNAVLFYLSV